jgi:hypothetical protein
LKSILNSSQGALLASQDRIYNWLDTQLSIARHYGGINIQGVGYVIDDTYKGHSNKAPLVKETVLKAEKKAAKEANIAENMQKTQEESLF